MLTFEKLRGSEVLARFRESQKDFEAIPFMRTDDFVDRSWDPSRAYEAHNLYIVAFEGLVPVGAIKFYKELPGKLEHLNDFLAREGIPLVQGRMFHGSYVGVNPAYRRHGIGIQLNNLLAKEMVAGDVFVFSSHEPDGAKLNARWFTQMGGDINVIFAQNYYGYTAYDPRKKNFVVSDPDRFRSLHRIVALWSGVVD